MSLQSLRARVAYAICMHIQLSSTTAGRPLSVASQLEQPTKSLETCHLSEMGSEEVRQPANNEPYYHTLEAPTGNQYHRHQPTEPVYHDPIHVTKIV